MGNGNYKITTQQEFSQQSISLEMKDANTINEIYVRNKIWHFITYPDGKIQVFNTVDRNDYDEKGRYKKVQQLSTH